MSCGFIQSAMKSKTFPKPIHSNQNEKKDREKTEKVSCLWHLFVNLRKLISQLGFNYGHFNKIPQQIDVLQIVAYMLIYISIYFLCVLWMCSTICNFNPKLQPGGGQTNEGNGRKTPLHLIFIGLTIKNIFTFVWMAIGKCHKNFIYTYIPAYNNTGSSKLFDIET